MNNICELNIPVSANGRVGDPGKILATASPITAPRISPPTTQPGFVETPPVVRTIPFVGHGLLPVRSNGSVRLPGFVKRTLAARASRIFLGLHETDTCLVGFSQNWQDRVTAELGRRRLEHLDGAKAGSCGGDARRIFGFCEEVWWPCDSVRLSEWARAVAGISEAALFVGTGETFEIWSPEDAEASGDANLVAIARSAAKFRVQV